MTRTISCVSIAIFLFSLPGCTKTENAPASATVAKQPPAEESEATVTFPNYRIINAPSKDPDKQWYVSDFFRRVEQWEPEVDVVLEDLQRGMYELTQYPNMEPTPEQQAAADKLVSDSFDAVIRNGWMDKQNGLSDGYELMYGDRVHYVNIDYVFDGETLNPDKPEVLMYYKANGSEYLMGVMFLAIGERGPQIGGPLSKWHYHIDRTMCYESGVLPIDTRELGGTCEKGFPNIRSPEMLHVWFFDHPEGKFATKMGLSDELLRFGIEQVTALQQERE
jgi:hypothetical protein